MAKFELKSDYQPMGDQPKAIAQLTDGLKNGVKEQTLLGVTGSGKSVVGSSKILIERNGSGQHIRIDKLNSIFTKKLPLDNDATQLVELEKGMLCTIALDTDSGKTIKGEVREISRHTYSGDLYTVQTSCGRENQFTDSHNVYVMRDGELKLLPSRSLRVGDWLPIPDKLPELNSPGIDYIDTREWLPEGAFYVSVEQKELIAVGELKQQKVWRVRNAGERVSLAAYNNMTVPNMSTLKDRVGSIKRTASVPVRIPVSRSLCKFLGLYIAEGHAEKNYITLTTADKSIAEDFAAGARVFGLRLKKRKSPYDYQISSKVLAALLKQLCGTSAGSKHLPSFWPSCSNAQLASLLSGVFAGDGWVENGSVCLASSSKELITDIQAALLRYGIHARSKPKRVVYRGIVRPSWVLRICGQDDLRRFQKHVSFGLSRKDEALAQQLNSSAIANTNVDVFPLSGEYLRVLCSQLNLYQRDIAKALGVSRSLISFYMSDQRRPSRKRAKKLIKFLLTRLAGTNEEKAAQKLTALLGLTEVFWSPISSIEAHTVTHEVVFDLAVPEYQTFFSGDGGYFVHNTFSMANIVQNVQKPTLVISHNKTLAAQLYSEFKRFFPNNAVHYFVSYFDYYQPEAYIPRSDTYIEKDSAINEEIDRLRHAATSALLSRRDVLIVASVSCIYGIGSVEDYGEMAVEVTRGERRVRDKFLRQLTDIQYQRNDIDFHRSTFRVRGDVVDIFPAGEEVAYRVEFFGDEIDRITKLDPLTGEILANLDNLKVFPGSHYVTPQDKLKVAIGKIEQELEQRLHYFKQNNLLLEAQRLNQRTQFDLEMLAETGFVKGIENYSRYLTNREPGEQPATLLDYFPDDYLMFIDESHMTIPQVRGMYNGDRARKEVLVEHGFRLPSALDNRPLTFTEFEKHVNQVVYVSATPAQYELSRSPEPAQQVIRPTGLLDPPIEVRPIEGQIDDLIDEIKATVDKRQRVLVTTLTKRMAEDLTEYLQDIKIKVTYLHSDIDTLERTDILRDLRLGTYDVVVGINLLREGLDLPEVSLVAILDADKEGFLRSEQALIQTVGRAARHVEGRVVMYADTITGSMQRTIDETNRRRKVQEAYNKKHGITPQGIAKTVEKGLRPDLPEEAKTAKLDLKKIPKEEYKHLIKDLSAQMDLASANLEFEKAAELRDIIADIKSKL